MPAIDPKTLAMMPNHVRARLESAEPAAPAVRPPTTIIGNTTPVEAAPVAAAPIVAAPTTAPAAPADAVAPTPTLPNLAPGGRREATAFEPVVETPPTTESDELTKLRKELADANAKLGTKPAPVWTEERMKKYADVLGDDVAEELHNDLMSLRGSTAQASTDVVTRKELAENARKAQEDSFFKALPAEFYTNSAKQDTPFMQWANDTLDGRRSVKDELAAVVRSRDLDGVAYINAKLTQFAKHRGATAPAPGTIVPANSAVTNAIPGEKQKATPADQAAIRAMVRAGNLKGADELLRSFT